MERRGQKRKRYTRLKKGARDRYHLYSKIMKDGYKVVGGKGSLGGGGGGRVGGVCYSMTYTFFKRQGEHLALSRSGLGSYIVNIRGRGGRLQGGGGRWKRRETSCLALQAKGKQ